MKENCRRFFGKRTITWISALVCSVCAVLLLCALGMLMVSVGVGFHGKQYEQMLEEANGTALRNHACYLLNRLSETPVRVYDPATGIETERTLEEMKAIWAETAAEAEEDLPMDYAVVVSEQSDLDLGELKSAGAFLYCSPEHADYAGYMQLQYFREYYSVGTSSYERLYYSPWREGYGMSEGELPLGKPYYLYVLYSRGEAVDGGRASCLSADETAFIHALYTTEHSVILMPFLALLILAGLVVFIKYAGYRNGEEEVRLGFFDRIPFLIFLGVTVGAELILIGLTVSFFGSTRVTDLIGFNDAAVLLGGALFVMAVIGFALLHTICVRIKAKMFLRTTFAYYCYRLVKKIFLKAGNWVVMHVPLAVRLFVLVPVAGIITLIEAALIQDASTAVALLFILARLWGIALIVYLVWGYARLRDGASRMAAGHLEQPVRETYLTPEYRSFAKDLNGMGQSIQVAVEERMKSEHLKTQLITNVSHDIKTPLTSIINYVDLMQKENTTEEERKEYLGILAHQSDRLKKLIQDLIDASKASSGAVEVSLSETDLCTMVGQITGEYQDKMEAAGLSVITRNMGEEVKVSADGNLLWRVMDNLFTNVLKYAMPGTRVYIETKEEAGTVLFTVSNISNTELGVTGDELMERFVRGDRSRNTEGSGLGLSIAKSLMELMGGDLVILVDGDMFKAVLKLKRWE